MIFLGAIFDVEWPQPVIESETPNVIERVQSLSDPSEQVYISYNLNVMFCRLTLQ